MDIKELNQKIAEVNQKIVAVSNERTKNLGKRETLEKQYAQAIEVYKAKYGVELTPDTLANEVASVTAEKTAQLEKAEKALSLIDAGDFGAAEELLTGHRTETAASVVMPTVEDTEDEGIEGVESKEDVAEKANDFEEFEPTVSAPTTPVSAPTTTPVSAPAAEEVVAPAPAKRGRPKAVKADVMEEVPSVGIPPIAPPTMDSVVAPPPVVGKPKPKPAAKKVAQTEDEGIPSVFDSVTSPLDAMAGFSKPQQGIPVGGSVAEEVEEEPAVAKPKSFGAIFGGSEFKNKN